MRPFIGNPQRPNKYRDAGLACDVLNFDAMRLAGLLIVIGIIGFFWSRRGAPVGSSPDVEEAMATPVAQPALAAPSSSATPAPSSGLRRPVDRTRNVLEQVKGRNGAGEF